MLEAGNVLRAWRLLEEPAMGRMVAAEANFDHRQSYLDYEGPVPGNRGRVTRWDAGVFDWLYDDGVCVEVRLRGTRLTGRAIIGATTFELRTSPG